MKKDQRLNFYVLTIRAPISLNLLLNEAACKETPNRTFVLALKAKLDLQHQEEVLVGACLLDQDHSYDIASTQLFLAWFVLRMDICLLQLASVSTCWGLGVEPNNWLLARCLCESTWSSPWVGFSGWEMLATQEGCCPTASVLTGTNSLLRHWKRNWEEPISTSSD